ncbi:J-domain-containing protein [Rhodococcus sp. P1Y]|uniref:DnaJ family domain-containing protein n=1 Tax=Rhodococcus sp. P1Y TaxID=1302308 RepID=UPI000EB03D39|nr:DUF1992 domain-containing protein [Rhodococcus sp. P1Y]AYJ49210.1 DUF1992 domain-containing protein [Rhodococcus sp. P1Y]
MVGVTERKKPGVTFESFVDKQIREAQERGAFENLEGAGKPIPASTDDELWWVRGFLQRENLTTDALLPESLQLRKEIERLPRTLIGLRFEHSVREQLNELNARVVAWIRMPSPPLIPISPVDVDEWVEQWRVNRAAADAEVRATRMNGVSGVSTPVPNPSRPSRWRRALRRLASGLRVR